MTDPLKPTRRVMIAAAMQDELELVLKAFAFETHGDHFTLLKNNIEWTAVRFGLGEAGVRQMLRPAIDRHQPDQLIVIGFAGGLDPRLEVGELFRIGLARTVNSDQQIVLADGDGKLAVIDADAMPAKMTKAEAILSTPVPIGVPDSKAKLFESTGTPLVDMESFFIASLCAQIGLPVTIWRAVSDAAGDSIPVGLMGCVRPDGTVDTFKAIRYLAVRPWLWSKVIRLRSNARRAATALVQAIRNEMRATESDTPHV